MKDKNGIEICCENCMYYEYCDDMFFPDVAKGGDSCNFEVSNKALQARIQELQEHNDTLQKRVEEFSMELLDRIMKDNKDVLERLKQAESEENNQ